MLSCLQSSMLEASTIGCYFLAALAFQTQDACDLQRGLSLWCYALTALQSLDFRPAGNVHPGGVASADHPTPLPVSCLIPFSIVFIAQQCPQVQTDLEMPVPSSKKIGLLLGNLPLNVDAVHKRNLLKGTCLLRPPAHLEGMS